MKKQKGNAIKYCIDCNCKLIIGTNWTESMKSKYLYLCNDCHNKRNRIWDNANQNRVRGYRNDWNKENREYYLNWRIENPDYINDYRQTLKGKLSTKKANAKRKGYDSIFLFDNPFPDDIPVVGHHISDGFEVYLPESLHLNHYTGKNKEKHRQELMPYIESIYEISYVIV